MQVLLVGDSAPVLAWFQEALATDSAVAVEWECFAEPSEAVARLRDQVYDVVLISSLSDSPASLHFLDAIRAGSSDEQPILVLGTLPEQQMADLCYESGADAYLDISTTSARAMLWRLSRAMERHQLLLENRKFRNAQHHRLQLEHDEATRLLQQQRQLIAGLESIHQCSDIEAVDSAAGNPHDHAPLKVSGKRPSTDLPDHAPSALSAPYSELLRTYVVMGSGNLGAQILQFAELLTAENFSSQQLMMMHLQVLEQVIASLGNRSARHVLNRADLLILEVMMHLAECYRVRGASPLSPSVEPVSSETPVARRSKAA